MFNEFQDYLREAISKSEKTPQRDDLNKSLASAPGHELASFFTDIIYLKSALDFLIQDHWIYNQTAQSNYNFQKFIKKHIDKELKPLLYLHDSLINSSLSQLKAATLEVGKMEKHFLSFIISMDPDHKKKFLQNTLRMMSEFYELEHQLDQAKDPLKPVSQMSLYRAFDVLDDIFGMHYDFSETASITQKERLYEGAGGGVQSSYASVLLALRYLPLPKAAKFIDLGSGYGRLGFVIGLLRPDVEFYGFEYVNTRVQAANKICMNLQINQNVHFLTQDLSKSDFQIPVADVYYIFDSFTDETFQIVMAQLEQLALTHHMIVITKGNARLWMKKGCWSEPQEFHGGNLCFYRSRTSRQKAPKF